MPFSRDRSPSPPRGGSSHRFQIDDGLRSPSYSPPRGRSPRGAVAFRTAIGDVVIAPEERRHFPSRRALRDANPRNLRDIEDTLSRAPWWDVNSIYDRELIAYYVDENGMLPDGLPGSVVDSFDFTRRCLVPRQDLRARGDIAWYRHIRDVYARSTRMPCGDPIPAEYGVDLYCYRTYGEVEYVEAIVDLEVPRAWRGMFGVTQQALCFSRPLLRTDFRYASKSGSAYWTWVKWERRMQRNDGLLVGYHSVEYQNLRLPRRPTRFPRAPPRLCEIDLPTHCYVDSPLSLAYVGSYLMSPESGWWVVYYTERAAKAACFILWDVYDRHKLWRIPPRLTLWMRELDLTRVLGSPVNAEDFSHLLQVVEDTDWSTGEVMDTQAGGNSRTGTADDDNIAIGDAEFIWYEPWTRARIDERTANSLRFAEGRRTRPEGHPVGYRYNPPLPPVAVQALSWAQSVIPTMPASQFYEEDNGAVVFAGGVSHRRAGMVLDDRAAEQRRIAPRGRTGSRIADQSASARAGPSSDTGRTDELGVRRSVSFAAVSTGYTHSRAAGSSECGCGTGRGR